MKWLAGKYGGEDRILPFEKNAETINYLYELMTLNRQQTMQNKIITEYKLDLSEQYKAEQARLLQMIRVIKEMTSADLDLSATSSGPPSFLHQAITSISSVAYSLGIKDSELSSIYYGITSNQEEEFKLTEKCRQQQKINQKKKKDLHKSHNAHNQIQKGYNLAEEGRETREAMILQQKEEIFMFKNKHDEYVDQLAELKQQVSDSGFHEDIAHSKLVALSAKLENIEQQNFSNSSKLSAYNDLPADFSLAQIKLDEAKWQLNELENELKEAVSKFM